MHEMTTSSLFNDRRALVLGGGGSSGNAWLLGVVAGLAAAGPDVTTADLIVGTSAGSTAAAMITSATPAELYDATISAVVPATPPVNRISGAVSDQLSRTQRIIDSSDGISEMRRRMGAAAIELDNAEGGVGSARWRGVVERRLPSQEWPEQRILLTAVDAHTGEPVAFDRDSGVDLADAVAASCAGGPAYRIGDRQYIDGGYRANADNADLAAGCGRVLVLSPFGGATRVPLNWHVDLASQIDELRRQGSRVETIFPEGEGLKAFGGNAMDLSARPPAARAGYAQGQRAAQGLTDFWS